MHATLLAGQSLSTTWGSKTHRSPSLRVIGALPSSMMYSTACDVNEGIHVIGCRNTYIQALAGKWSNLLQRGERPAMFFARDGHKLTKVPMAEKIPKEKLILVFQEALNLHPWILEFSKPYFDNNDRALPGRGDLALMRAVAYLSAGNAAQAAKDARTAIAYCSSSSCSWALAAAHFIMGAAEEKLQDAVTAAYHMQKAHELHPSNPRFKEEADRLVAALEDEGARGAALLGGAQGLQEWVQQMKAMQLPEFLRPRPKYHFYNTWMRERIEGLCPSLQEEVVQKLLAMDAGDLHFMCQHPLALSAQAEEYSDVYRLYGGQYLLHEYEGEALSWQEIKALTGGDMVGLPIGYDAGAMEHGGVAGGEGRGEAKLVQELAAHQRNVLSSGQSLSRKELLLAAIDTAATQHLPAPSSHPTVSITQSQNHDQPKPHQHQVPEIHQQQHDSTLDHPPDPASHPPAPATATPKDGSHIYKGPLDHGGQLTGQSTADLNTHHDADTCLDQTGRCGQLRGSYDQMRESDQSGGSDHLGGSDKGVGSGQTVHQIIDLRRQSIDCTSPTSDGPPRCRLNPPMVPTDIEGGLPTRTSYINVCEGPIHKLPRGGGGFCRFPPPPAPSNSSSSSDPEDHPPETVAGLTTWEIQPAGCIAGAAASVKQLTGDCTSDHGVRSRSDSQAADKGGLGEIALGSAHTHCPEPVPASGVQSEAHTDPDSPSEADVGLDSGSGTRTDSDSDSEAGCATGYGLFKSWSTVVPPPIPCLDYMYGEEDGGECCGMGDWAPPAVTSDIDLYSLD